MDDLSVGRPVEVQREFRHHQLIDAHSFGFCDF